MGNNNTAGCRGYYFNYIDTSAISRGIISLYLSRENTPIQESGSVDTTFPTPLYALSDVQTGRLGDIISVIAGDNVYLDGFLIMAEQNNVLTLIPLYLSPSDLPSIAPEDTRLYLFCREKPEIGLADLGYNASSSGENTKALGANSHTEGHNTIASNDAHAEGSGSMAGGQGSHAENHSFALGLYSHSEGTSGEVILKLTGSANATTFTVNDMTDDEFKSATRIGTTHISGAYIIDRDTTNQTITFNKPISNIPYNKQYDRFYTGSIGNTSHSEGISNIAAGKCSHAEGYNNAIFADTDSVHVEGHSNTVEDGVKRSHAEGYQTKIIHESPEKIIQAAHVEGWNTTVKYKNVGTGGDSDLYGASAHGYFTESQNRGEFACGSRNISNKASESFGNAGNTLFSIGCGKNASGGNKNAFEVMQNGDIYIYGKGGYDGTNPSTATPLQEVIPDAYLKSASVANNTLTLTPKEGEPIVFSPEKDTLIITTETPKEEWLPFVGTKMVILKDTYNHSFYGNVPVLLPLVFAHPYEEGGNSEYTFTAIYENTRLRRSYGGIIFEEQWGNLMVEDVTKLPYDFFTDETPSAIWNIWLDNQPIIEPDTGAMALSYDHINEVLSFLNGTEILLYKYEDDEEAGMKLWHKYVIPLATVSELTPLQFDPDTTTVEEVLDATGKNKPIIFAGSQAISFEYQLAEDLSVLTFIIGSAQGGWAGLITFEWRDSTQVWTRSDKDLVTEDDLAGKQDKTDNSLTTSSKQVVGAINENKQRIDNLFAIGRYLAIWNAKTGLPTSNPSGTPYPYKAGDWFLVGIVADEGGTNYMPYGTEYTGEASTTPYTEEVPLKVGDRFFFDGTTWKPLIASYVGSVVDVTFDGVSVLDNGVAKLFREVTEYDYAGSGVRSGRLGLVRDDIDGVNIFYAPLVHSNDDTGDIDFGGLYTGNGDISVIVYNRKDGIWSKHYLSLTEIGRKLDRVALIPLNGGGGINSVFQASGGNAKGDYSVSLNRGNSADGANSFSIGWGCSAPGQTAFASGRNTVANGVNSHTEGGSTITQNITEHAEGRFNKSHQASSTYGNKGNTQHSVGIGKTEDGRRNAFEIMQNGEIYIMGVGGYDGTNPTSKANSLQKVLENLGVTIDWTKLDY